VSVQLFKFLDSAWETARGYLREDLDHLEVAINTLEGRVEEIEANGGGGGADLGTISAGVLIGRGVGSAGAFEEITVGTGLVMTGTVLSATGGTGGINAAKVAARVALRV
jgi:hypothetical protein